jgi:hypothetical protein
MAKKRFKLAYFTLVLALVFAISPLSAQENADSTEAKNRKSPTGALLRSLALPGWGQLYNQKYLKAGIIGIGESLLIYQTVYYYGRTNTYRDLYQNETDTELRQQYFNQFDSYRDLRNQHIWFLAITVFYSMFDAYVDAHLAGFDIDLTPTLDEQTHNTTLWLKLNYRY